MPQILFSVSVTRNSLLSAGKLHNSKWVIGYGLFPLMSTKRDNQTDRNQLDRIPIVQPRWNEWEMASLSFKNHKMMKVHYLEWHTSTGPKV